MCLFGGDVAAAASLNEEANGLAEATGSRIVPPYGVLTVAAFRGREDELERSVATSTEDFIRHGEGMGLTVSLWATALLCNGLGAIRGSVRGGRAGDRGSHASCGSRTSRLVELIEAASRSDGSTRDRERCRS